jgi:hypothetical protein
VHAAVVSSESREGLKKRVKSRLSVISNKTMSSCASVVIHTYNRADYLDAHNSQQLALPLPSLRPPLELRTLQKFMAYQRSDTSRF